MAHIEGSEIVRASVWIRPTGAALDKVQKLVNEARRMSQAQEGKPHVSLLGGIETTLADAQRKLKRLAERIEPFTLRIGRIAWRDEYYRSFYLQVELSPELQRAQHLAHEVFEMNPPDRDFDPHISLVYGDFQEGLKRQMAEELGGGLDLRFTAASVHLVNASAGVAVSDWRTLFEASFQRQPETV